MKTDKKIKRVALILFIFTIALAIGLFAVWSNIYSKINFESDERLFESSLLFESTVFYADGSTDDGYQPVAVETGRGLRKSFYSLEEMSPYIAKGIIAVEDKIFYEHNGIDVKRTFMAAANYLLRRSERFGASTITQQVIKNISGDNKPTVRRKAEEIIRALHIEQKYTKDQILEVYLNVIPMSENIYGVGAACRAYFGKEPGELSPSEAATLIGITNAPTAYNPYLNPDLCRKKRDIVLSVMLKDGVITDSQYEGAVSEQLKVIPREKRSDNIDSWFVEVTVDEITADLAAKFGTSKSAARMMLLGGGYKVYTTMNREVQECLENYFENTANLPPEVSGGLNYSMVVIDSVSGDLAGIVGRAGKKEGNRLLNHALVPHVPASTLKPLALYAPLLNERKINWATVFDDIPVSFSKTDDGYREYPVNSPNVYDGLTTVSEALKKSKNTVAVRLFNILGARRIYDSLERDFSFDSLVRGEGGITDMAASPLALGQLSYGVSLIKLTEGYGAFSGNGVRRDARSYICLYDHKGDVVLEKHPEGVRLFDEETAKIMNQLLMGVVSDGTASMITLKNHIDVAGKTGTSAGNRDKLFVGYTPVYTAGIWCGYDNSTGEVSGLSVSHLKIWDDIMTKLHESRIGKERLRFSTEGILYLPYCMDSGREYCENCMYDPRGSRTAFGYFTEDNMPKGKCDRHVICSYDYETKSVASKGCPEENMINVSLINVPERSFPKEIIVTDAEFVYRDSGRYDNVPIDYALPYFFYSIPEGTFVGRSKGKKQFNSGCYLHDE